MKRSQQRVPKAETGAIRGDGSGSQSIIPVNKGGRNATTEEAHRGAGQVAPRPQTSREPLLSSSSATAPVQAAMARVKNVGSSPTGKGPTAGSFTPLGNNAMANLTGQSTGQREVAPRGASVRVSPMTRTPMVGNEVATKKPKRRGLGAAFYGEYS
jgi:hypothetical protein